MKAEYLVLQIRQGPTLRNEASRLRDAFLDVYSLYLLTRISWVREDARRIAYELHLVDPTFRIKI